MHDEPVWVQLICKRGSLTHKCSSCVCDCASCRASKTVYHMYRVGQNCIYIRRMWPYIWCNICKKIPCIYTVYNCSSGQPYTCMFHLPECDYSGAGWNKYVFPFFWIKKKEVAKEFTCTKRATATLLAFVAQAYKMLQEISSASEERRF